MCDNPAKLVLIEKLHTKAKALQREAFALYIAARDPRVPWYAKAFMGLVLAYAFSPVDLIPDFIPVLGYLDDLILVPLGITLALKMISPQVMSDARQLAEERMLQEKPVSRAGAALIIIIWLIIVLALIWWLASQLSVVRA